jgi:predicted porin
MNKNIKLAVAGAVFALSATANAGIIIPAGDWTVDISGNVNTFMTNTKYSGAAQAGRIAGSTTAAGYANADNNASQFQTGLLPSAIGIGAKTRQNDLDVAVQFSFFTGSNANGGDNLNSANRTSNGGLGYSSLNIRQSYLSFGDKSWGTILLGRNLGVFGSDAILSDMTLLGVGSGAGGQGSSTLGRIGSGYIYADWKAQVAYTTPNFNGFEATVAATEATGQLDNNNLNFEGKASYSFAADAVTGKVWVGGKKQKIQTATAVAAGANGNISEFDAEAAEIGAKLGFGGAELVGYYYDGKNVDSSIGTAINTNVATPVAGFNHDNTGGYVQATYILPTKTKVGASWGISKIERATVAELRDAEREAWVIGAYHPLTKHLNLVAEYNHLTTESQTVAAAAAEGKQKTMSLGAILFF